MCFIFKQSECIDNNRNVFGVPKFACYLICKYCMYSKDNTDFTHKDSIGLNFCIQRTSNCYDTIFLDNLNRFNILTENCIHSFKIL